MKATIITIGDEILIGHTLDTNSAWIASQLNLIGIPVTEILSIPDQQERIIEALDRSLAVSDLVLVTGGLGPTQDDITKQVLTDYFGDTLVVHDETMSRLEAYFKLVNLPMLEMNRYQAMLPKNATIIRNDLGTAAGMWFERSGKPVISMPGVPYEMQGLMEKIIPLLQSRYKLADFFHRTIHFQGIGESYLAENIKEIEKDCRERGIAVAYLPSIGLVKLRLTGSKADTAYINTVFDHLLKTYPELVYGFGHDSLESVAGSLLIERNLTLSTVESCTGGALASRIVSVSGSSAYFMGSVVSYSNDSKERLVGVSADILRSAGAVSQETAEQMAARGRLLLGTDYCIATSGVAGPDGGTPEKPVGTVWIAVAGPDKVYSKKFNFRHNRERNIESTVVYALNFLRRVLLKLQ